MNQTHIIHLEEISLTLTSAKGIHPLQERVSRLCQDALHPRLDTLFSSLVHPNQWIRLEELSIDLGHITLDNLQTQWVDLVLAEVERALEKQLAGHWETINDQEKKDKALAYHGIQLSAREEEVFLFFLEHGYIPWWGDKKLVGVFWEEIVQRDTIELVLKARMSDLIVGSSGALRRLLSRIPKRNYVNFAKLLVPQSKKQWVRPPEKHLRSVDGLRQFVAKYPLFIDRLWEKWIVWIISASNDRVNFTRSVEEEVFKLANEVLQAMEASEELHDELFYKNIVLLKDGPTSARQAPSREMNVERAAYHEEKKLETKEGIYIDNAGLLLLHPFLPNLFENVGLTKEHQFINSHTCQQAIYLLQYLVNGERSEVCPEYELVLNKIICGWPVNDPLDAILQPSTLMFDEADVMLQSVMRHWDSVRKLEVEGLRSLLINRLGRLTTNGTGWQIRVETQAQDLFLESMPWGVGIISFPWLDKLISVNWM